MNGITDSQSSSAGKPDFNGQEFTSRLHAGLQQAEQQTMQLRKANTWLFLSGLVGSAVATLVAGLTSAMGPLVGEGIQGWRIACIVAAIFSFISTLAMGIHQQLRLNDRLSENQQCLGRLRALDFSLVSGNHNWSEAAKEYAEILRAFPEALR